MTDRPNQDRDPVSRLAFTNLGQIALTPLEQARIDYARARADQHNVRELYFLELALGAPDDDSARVLELYAYDAYQDAQAITREHNLND
jgi:hypothetical protein